MLLTWIRNLMDYGFSNPIVREGLISLLLSLPVFLFSLSFHEAAHGYVAYRCGDPTAYMLGRVTLNPVKHIDPLGFLLLMTAGFGWAKPVPVNPRNFRSYRKDDLKVSMAGICGNLVLMVLATLVLFLLYWIVLAAGIADSQALGYVERMLWMFVSTNIVLAFFNLIPVPPLDGYHLLNDLLLKKPLFAAQNVQRISYGILIAILFFTDWVDRYLSFVQIHVINSINGGMAAVFRAMGLM